MQVILKIYIRVFSRTDSSEERDKGKWERTEGKEGRVSVAVFYSVWQLVDSSCLFLILSADYSFRAECSLDHKTY